MALVGDANGFFAGEKNEFLLIKIRLHFFHFSVFIGRLKTFVLLIIE